MSRKSFIVMLLACLWISGCGATVTTASEKQFKSVNKEGVTATDSDLYQAISNVPAAPADRTALAVDIEKFDPAQLPAIPTKPLQIYEIGDTRIFWTQNSTSFESKQITAKLMFISKHAYFWQDVDSAALEAIPLWPRWKGQDAARLVRDPEWLAKVRLARGIYFTGGTQERITTVLLEKDGTDTPLLKEIRALQTRGGVVAGSSAGAAIMSTTMIREISDVLGVMQEGIEKSKHLDRGLGFVGPRT